MALDVSGLLFEVADTFSMEVHRRRNTSVGALKGEARYALPMIEGLHWEIAPKIVDSAVHEDRDKVAALLHVTGSLYVLLILDGTYTDRTNDNFARLWVLDGAKLGWNKQTGFLVFPTQWNRAKLYEGVQDGVVTAFCRSRNRAGWVEVQDARKEMEDYLKRKAKTVASMTEHVLDLVHKGQTEAERVVARLKTENSIADRYRTKGPRGV